MVYILTSFGQLPLFRNHCSAIVPDIKPRRSEDNQDRRILELGYACIIIVGQHRISVLPNIKS